jgi:hypothetical protein
MRFLGRGGGRRPALNQFAHHVGCNRKCDLSASRCPAGKRSDEMRRLLQRRLTRHRRLVRINCRFDENGSARRQRLTQSVCASLGIIEAEALPEMGHQRAVGENSSRRLLLEGERLFGPACCCFWDGSVRNPAIDATARTARNSAACRRTVPPKST